MTRSNVLDALSHSHAPKAASAAPLGARSALDLNEGHLTENIYAPNDGLDVQQYADNRFDQVATIRKRISADGSVEFFASIKKIDRYAPARTPPGYVNSVPKETSSITKETSAERAGRRAKRAVRERVLAIQADRLVTLTYRGAMTDFQRLLKDFQSLLDRLRYAGHKFEYVAVPEQHKSGGWHIHMAVHGRQDYKLLRSCWWRVVGEGQGNVDVKNPFGRQPRRHQLALYLAKYVGKTLDAALVEKDRKRYWSTRGIPQPQKELQYVDAFDLHHLIELVYEQAAAHGLSSPVFWCSRGDSDFFWLIASPPR